MRDSESHLAAMPLLAINFCQSATDPVAAIKMAFSGQAALYDPGCISGAYLTSKTTVPLIPWPSAAAACQRTS